MAIQVVRRPFTVEEYYRMAEAGILHEDDRVELLEGDIVEMAPIGSRHAACVRRLNQLFFEGLRGRAIVSVQDPVRLSDRSEPQPDLALLLPRPDFYAASHPGPQDVLLIVEVADTSQEYDRGVKMALYSRAGIPEVWLVDLASQVIEVYQQPGPQGYRDISQTRSSQRLSPQAFPDLELAVGDVLV